jgi:DNA repair and recombination protein RAD54B
MLAEYVVFITPTVLQLSMFYKILNPDKLNDLIQSSTAESLALINTLTKISNSPILLKATADKVKNRKNGAVDPVQRGAVNDALDLLPPKAHIADMSLSGKSICCGLDDRQRIFINLLSRKTYIPCYNAQNDTSGNMKLRKFT